MTKLLHSILLVAIFTSTTLAQITSPKDDNCGCEGKPLPEVLSTVNGVKITAKDFDPATQSAISELKRQVIEARKLELDLQINSILLDAEAKKRNISSTKLLEEEVIAKAKEPTEEDARKFFEEQKARIKDSSVEFSQVKDQIFDYVRQQRRQELAKAFAGRLRAAADVKVLVETATPPEKPADRQRVFAIVNGKQITSDDIENSLHSMIYSVQEEMYDLRRRDLDRKIHDALLSQEAQKRQITTRALVEEVKSKVATVTEEQAQKFYNTNRDKMNGEFPALKEQIIWYLQNAEAEKLQLSFAAGLRKTATVQDFLTPPEPPVYAIATDDQPVMGDAKATVTLVEFTDFQCPSCSELQPVLEKVVKEYDGRVKLVVRDYPLTRHEFAFKAAEAAEAAREQGKYWEYTAKLFGNQSALQLEKLKEYASEVGLDRARFDAALDGGKFKAQVQRDVLDGARVGVKGTPTLFVDGKRVSDRSYEGLKRTIDAALSARK